MILAKAVDALSLELPFGVTSGVLSVTDPCYQNNNPAEIISAVRHGPWLAQVGYYRDGADLVAPERHLAELRDIQRTAAHLGGQAAIVIGASLEESLKRATAAKADYRGRVAFLRIRHGGAVPINDLAAAKRLRFVVSVDSGQAGFFDRAAFVTACGPNFEAFYAKVGELTMSQGCFGTLPFGAAARSGYGDGAYAVHAVRDLAGLAIAAVILFIDNGS
jgi:hypothetical protein